MPIFGEQWANTTLKFVRIPPSRAYIRYARLLPNLNVSVLTRQVPEAEPETDGSWRGPGSFNAQSDALRSQSGVLFPRLPRCPLVSLVSIFPERGPYPGRPYFLKVDLKRA